MGYNLQPVYVLSMLDRFDGKFAVENLASFKAGVTKACQPFFEKAGLLEAKSLRILVAQHSSRKLAIEKLLHFAERLHSPWIVISSHGRTGLSRLAFGSFAENLLLQAKCPVFFLSHGAHLENSDKIVRILFPTDFSPASRLAFGRILKQAQFADIEIILFYSDNLSMTVLSAYETPFTLPDTYLEDHEGEIRKEAQSWIGLAKSQRVKATMLYEHDGINPNIAELILKVARETGANMISMACSSGALTAMTTGSVTRDVFRTGKYPVLVYGPNMFSPV